METGSDVLFSNLPRHENRIFTNRNIKLARIQSIGFDMDYTLAEYRQEALDKLTMELALAHLINKYNYPEEIQNIPYEDGFTIRGLVMDTQLGNVLKIDKFRYVSLAYHGLKPLDHDHRAKIYNSAARISFRSERYRSVDTLFEILETYLFAALIDHFEVKKGEKVDYKKLYTELRDSIDCCHADGSMKEKIMAEPEKYIMDDPLLIPTLHMFKEKGKQLFVLTNSEVEYTEFVLDFLFRNSEPFFEGWRDCFDIVGAAACKPKFFNDGTKLEILEEKNNLFFSGGNLEFLENRLEGRGDQVLYVGDHIYGDILKSKLSSAWRTCLIVPELDFQIKAESQTMPHLKELRTNEARRKQIAMELNWRRNQIADLYQFKEAEADELERSHLELLDERLCYLNRQVEAHHKELSRILYESKVLRRKISSSFNRYWGRLFKTGGQASAFAEQIRDYACIYTSKVSNFSYFNFQTYLQSVVAPMPHEDSLYSVHDINFDVSIETDSIDEPDITGKADVLDLEQMGVSGGL